MKVSTEERGRPQKLKPARGQVDERPLRPREQGMVRGLPYPGEVTGIDRWNAIGADRVRLHGDGSRRTYFPE